MEIHKTYPLVFSVFLSVDVSKKRIIIKMVARHCKPANIILGFVKKILCTEILNLFAWKFKLF